MARRGNRDRVATNVFDDATGRVIIYRDHDGKQKEIRALHGTPIRELRVAVETALAQSAASGIPKAERNTLADAVNRWEPLEKNLVAWRERRSELRAWCRASIDGKQLAHMAIRSLTEAMCRRVMSDWAQQGVAPKTIRQRRWSLQHLYHVLFGRKAITPVDDIPPPPKVKTIPIAIDPTHVLTVLANLIERERIGILKDAKTRARFMVRAVTGKRPSEIMRAQPSDVNLERREWRVRDGKGGWSEGLYLNDEMVTAWQVFIDAGAWGYFETSAMAVTLRAAGWAPGGDPYTRPYELRHSAGIALSDAGVDLADISAFLAHKDLRTTRQTYVPIRRARMQRASEVLQGRFNGWAVPATGASNAVDRRGIARKNVESCSGTYRARKQAKLTGKTRRK